MPEIRGGHPFPSPRFTESIDAALGLVPEGYPWRCGDHFGTEDGLGIEYRAHAYLIEPTIRTTGMGGGFDGVGATPAIALCIAALRARQAQGATAEAESPAPASEDQPER